MTKDQKKIVFYACLVIFIIIIITVIWRKRNPQPVTLEVWGFLDQADVFTSLVNNFQKLYPYITVNYTLKEQQNYEEELLKAFADNKAPDIFMVLGNWIPEYQDKIYPLDMEKDKDLNLKTIKEYYPEIIFQELVVKQKYLAGIPLSIDTLALFYNKDIFNHFNIALPPKTWEELISLIPTLRAIDENNNLTRPAIALGTYNNVNWGTDILSALMMQFGSDIVDIENRLATFNHKSKSGNTFKSIGEEALEFYLQFAKPKNKNYTWNSSFTNSVISFSKSKTAMIIGYSRAIDFIKKQNPQLNFGISNLPNFAHSLYQINYGTTINLVVSNRSKNPRDGWLFLKYLTQNEVADKYFNLTKRPPARRDLIANYLNDPTVGVFISQSLSAKSFYQFDFAKIKAIFEEMIYSAGTKKIKPAEVVNNAVLKFNFEWQKNK